MTDEVTWQIHHSTKVLGYIKFLAVLPGNKASMKDTSHPYESPPPAKLAEADI